MNEGETLYKVARRLPGIDRNTWGNLLYNWIDSGG